ncbi:la-related protein 6 [Ischnura elegans]|uniref:la-related protein 6 n=1 Tax=Ischnura elegans TaxID=197161 RepID=UPI001ED8B0C6|nr:la-related protein 6 [Ischnura elegans]
MPVPSEDGIPNIVVVKQPSAEEAEPSFPPPMKHRDTRDSISSVDSDISLSYDSSSRRDSAENPEIPADLGEDSGSESSTGGKDSGCDNDAEETEKKNKAGDDVAAPDTGAAVSATPADEEDGAPFEPPDDDLAARIVAQVEFYFSDVNITKDAFLLKHVKRNKEGYVSLKLISSFKRVKHLAKDWRVVAYALQRSVKLQVNEAKTKLRRVDPLPQYDETTPSRTVAVLDLPLERPTIENVAELFSPCGDIALVRILRPGNPVPADARPFVAKHPELSTSVCALVEFEKAECARKAVKEAEEARASGGGGMRVLELTKAAASSKKAAAKKAAEAKKEQQIQLLQQQIQQLQQIQRPQLLQVNAKKRTTRANARPSFVADAVLSGSNQDAEEKTMSEPARRRWSGPLERFQQRRSSSGLSCGNSPIAQRHKGSIGSNDQASSPWVQRRIAAAAETVVEGAGPGVDSPPTRPRSNSALLRGTLLLPENVVRMPRGPDGSKGFRCGFREMLLSKRMAAEGDSVAESPSDDASCALAC